MGHRSFTDAAGVVWDVWDVIPQWTERRSGGDRRRAENDEDVDPPVLERRRKTQRRGDTQDLSRVRIASGLSRGWLAFESARDKRRLAPVPPGWESMSDTELAGLCASATQAPSKRRLIE